MGLGNMAMNAAGDFAAKQKEMQDLMRGKTADQQSCIKFFYGAGGGCLSKGSMTAQQYQELVNAKLNKLDTKKMALKKLGIDEDEVREIEPITFEGYYFSDKSDNLVQRAGGNKWVSSEYQITWLFFGEKELFVYQYKFSMINDSKKENTMQYFYQDVTNFSASSETYQKWVSDPKGGCKGGFEYHQVSTDADEFKIVVPGDTLTCSLTPTDTTDTTIRGMRNKLREMKNR